MDQSSKNNYSASDIRRYHEGKMSAAEMHALEKAAQVDPFLADALEGYSFTATPMQDLEKIRERLEEKNSNRKVIPIFPRQRTWLSAAAIFMILAVAGWLIFKPSIDAENPVATTVNKVAAADSTSINQMLTNSNQPTDSLADQVYLNTKTDKNPPSGSLSAPGSKASSHITTSAEPPFTSNYSVQDKARQGENKMDMPATDSNQFRMNSGKSVAAAQQEIKDINRKNDSAEKLQSASNRDVALRAKREAANDTISHLNVVMQPVDQSVSEVVVARPGTQRKEMAKPIIIVDTLEPAEGWVKFDDYVANNLKVPDEIKQKEVSGEVLLSFDVNKNGEATNIQVEKSLCEKCDAEAIRLLKEGPKWKQKKNKKGRLIVRF